MLFSHDQLKLPNANIQSIQDEITLVKHLMTFGDTDYTYTNLLNFLLEKQQHAQTPNQTDDSYDINAAIREIDEELKTIAPQYDPEIATEDNYDFRLYDRKGKDKRIPSIRARFLLRKRRHLVVLNTDPLSIPEEEAQQSSTFWIKLKNFLKTPAMISSKQALDIIKKIVDVLDDLWAVISRASGIPEKIAEFVSPILIGGFGILIHLYEGTVGFFRFIKNLKKPSKPLRNGKIAANFFIFSSAGAGLGISIAFVVSAFGLAVSGTGLFPFLIPALVATVSLISLIHAATVIAQTKSLIADRKKEQAKLKQKIGQLRIKHQKPQRKLNLCNDYKSLIKHSADIAKVYTDNNIKYEAKLAELQNDFAKLDGEIARFDEKKADATRERAFKMTEIFFAAIVLTGIALGTAAIVGTSAATFGIFPIVLIGVGVGCGIALKLFEAKDTNSKHRFSNIILRKLSFTKAPAVAAHAPINIPKGPKAAQDPGKQATNNPTVATQEIKYQPEPHQHAVNPGDTSCSMFGGGKPSDRNSRYEVNFRDVAPAPARFY